MCSATWLFLRRNLHFLYFICFLVVFRGYGLESRAWVRRALGRTRGPWQDPGARSKILTFKQAWRQLKRMKAPFSRRPNQLKVNSNPPWHSRSATDKHARTSFFLPFNEAGTNEVSCQGSPWQDCLNYALKVGQKCLGKHSLHTETEAGTGEKDVMEIQQLKVASGKRSLGWSAENAAQTPLLNPYSFMDFCMEFCHKYTVLSVEKLKGW